MRKTRLVIQPVRCLHTIGFLLLCLSCPIFGDWGLIQPDSAMSHRAITLEREGARILVKPQPKDTRNLGTDGYEACRPRQWIWTRDKERHERRTDRLSEADLRQTRIHDSRLNTLTKAEFREYTPANERSSTRQERSVDKINMRETRRQEFSTRQQTRTILGRRENVYSSGRREETRVEVATQRRDTTRREANQLIRGSVRREVERSDRINERISQREILSTREAKESRKQDSRDRTDFRAEKSKIRSSNARGIESSTRIINKREVIDGIENRRVDIPRLLKARNSRDNVEARENGLTNSRRSAPQNGEQSNQRREAMSRDHQRVDGTRLLKVRQATQHTRSQEREVRRTTTPGRRLMREMSSSKRENTLKINGETMEARRESSNRRLLLSRNYNREDLNRNVERDSNRKITEGRRYSLNLRRERRESTLRHKGIRNPQQKRSTEDSMLQTNEFRRENTRLNRHSNGIEQQSNESKERRTAILQRPSLEKVREESENNARRVNHREGKENDMRRVIRVEGSTGRKTASLESRQRLENERSRNLEDRRVRSDQTSSRIRENTQRQTDNERRSRQVRRINSEKRQTQQEATQRLSENLDLSRSTQQGLSSISRQLETVQERSDSSRINGDRSVHRHLSRESSRLEESTRMSINVAARNGINHRNVRDVRVALAAQNRRARDLLRESRSTAGELVTTQRGLTRHLSVDKITRKLESTERTNREIRENTNERDTTLTRENVQSRRQVEINRRSSRRDITLQNRRDDNTALEQRSQFEQRRDRSNLRRMNTVARNKREHSSPDEQRREQLDAIRRNTRKASKSLLSSVEGRQIGENHRRVATMRNVRLGDRRMDERSVQSEAIIRQTPQMIAEKVAIKQVDTDRTERRSTLFNKMRYSQENVNKLFAVGYEKAPSAREIAMNCLLGAVAFYITTRGSKSVN